MKKLWLIILLSSIVFSLEAHAFFKSRKQAPIPPKQIRDTVSIDPVRDYYSNKVSNLKLAIFIPPHLDQVAVQVLYDEAEEDVQAIKWQISKDNITREISSIKSESNIETHLEELMFKLNPSLAYDRVSNGKHIRRTNYFFTKSEIFPVEIPSTTKRKKSKTPSEPQYLLNILINTPEGQRVITLDLSSKLFFTPNIFPQANDAKAATAPYSPEKVPPIPNRINKNPSETQVQTNSNNFDLEDEEMPNDLIPSNLPEFDLEDSDL